MRTHNVCRVSLLRGNQMLPPKRKKSWTRVWTDVVLVRGLVAWVVPVGDVGIECRSSKAREGKGTERGNNMSQASSLPGDNKEEGGTGCRLSVLLYMYGTLREAPALQPATRTCTVLMDNTIAACWSSRATGGGQRRQDVTLPFPLSFCPPSAARGAASEAAAGPVLVHLCNPHASFPLLQQTWTDCVSVALVGFLERLGAVVRAPPLDRLPDGSLHYQPVPTMRPKAIICQMYSS